MTKRARARAFLRAAVPADPGWMRWDDLLALPFPPGVTVAGINEVVERYGYDTDGEYLVRRPRS